MAVLKPRERLVYFRVSEDEFRQFVSVCEQAGARSVSDLARNAVQRLIAQGQQQRERQELEEKIVVLERLIAAVTEQLELLCGQRRGRVSPVTANSSERLFWETTTADHNGGREE